jgi:hypothetical protein
MRMTHPITNTASLQRVLWLRRGSRVKIALPSLSLAQQEKLQLHFNRQLEESGNEFCALALIASLVGCIFFDAAVWQFFTAHTLQVIVFNLLVCLVAAVLGKIYGALRARLQLARLIRTVAERLEEDHAAPSGERYAALKRRIST